ncbi:hypothetical protein HS088_TW14G00841 [Tripterygium wilfordii]|uniref:Uncharacterized protein n=1 Tax=Tripterygium wilfordii TaxID=458696 RepID=A0A7J7CRK3_TRIWF|nr:uncharacterized protein LOC120014931 [Tripterygium wilfordii]KAF5736691.1 hypothetical protein HS088_TW14G00841 [Tripterygium wilfordii]
MESGVVLSTKPSSCFISSSIPQFQSWHPTASNLLPHSSLVTVRYRRWDSNAESPRSRRFDFNFRDRSDAEEDDYDEYSRSREKKRWWWSVEGEEEDEEEDIEGPGILEAALDSVWIFKVFKSFGWMLPPIIISTLLASGPKAFLMALAIPLGQSALSLIFEKLWGRTKGRSKRKARMRRKPFAKPESNVDTEEENEEEQESPEAGKGKMGYQSWAVGNEGPVDNERAQGAASFGGWDDLDRAATTRGPSQGMGRNPRRTKAEKSKLSRRGRSETPLLLRLLIAVFPILGSWTRML